MSIKHLFLSLFLSVVTTNAARAVETVTEFYLNTVDSGEGYWPCLFYELNYNSDISPAEKARWYSLEEDETYWREGIGPFSIDENKFLVTQWQSTVHPILIRRHFTLNADDLLKISIGTVTLTYSYDENPTFWLNGTKIVSANGWNDNDYASFRLPAARKRLLVEGDNVLCVSLQQGVGGGHIDYGLSITYNPNHTGIEEIENSTLNNEQSDDNIYDLSGRRIENNKSQSGIFITKGKKILIK